MIAHVFPGHDEKRCGKCNKTVIITVADGRPGIHSECEDPFCPINRSPAYQGASDDGVDICFAENDAANEPTRQK